MLFYEEITCKQFRDIKSQALQMVKECHSTLELKFNKTTFYINVL